MKIEEIFKEINKEENCVEDTIILYNMIEIKGYELYNQLIKDNKLQDNKSLEEIPLNNLYEMNECEINALTIYCENNF